MMSAPWLHLPPRRRPAPGPGGRQRGFSLIEIALALVLISLLGVATLQAKGLLTRYQQHQFVSQVRNLIGMLQDHQTQLGRWPGDCNRDGLLDPLLSGNETAALLDFASPTSLTAAASSTTPYSLGTVCPESTLDGYTSLNVAFNELKRGGQLPTGEPNRLAATHGMGGQAFLGSFTTILTNPNDVEDRFNAILLTAVPISAARSLAVALDGHDGGDASRYRVRRMNSNGGFATRWTGTNEDENKRITVVVFFDRIPPTQP